MKCTLLAVVVASAFAQEQTGSLEGTVIDSVTHLGVRKARVTLMPQGRMMMRRPVAPRPPASGGRAEAPSFEPPPMPTASTDASGRFVFNSVEPGLWGVAVEHPSYPPRSGMRPQIATVQVAAGGEPAHVSVELTPGATITGRIVDQDGDPIYGCSVQLMAARAAEPNRYVSVLGSEPTNDQGIYRVYGISATKVHVFARCDRGVFQPRPLLPMSEAPEPSLAYIPKYYPGVEDVSGAQAIELTPGSVREGVDFRMTPARVYTVSGAVRLLPGAKPPEGSANYLMLVKRDSAGSMFASQRGGPIDWLKGTFKIVAVPPGSYTIVAPGALGLQGDVDVIDRPVSVTVDLRPPVDVNGSISIEGETRTPLNRMTLQFTPEDRMGRGFNAAIKDDGTFTATGLGPVRYFVRVSWPDVFVKAVNAGGHDAPNNLLDLRNGASDIRVVLSARTGTISGTAPPGRSVQATRLDPTEMMFGGRGTSSDPNGTFKLSGLAPGKYRVSLDGAEDGQEVSVAEGETVTLELKAPPGQQ